MFVYDSLLARTVAGMSVSELSEGGAAVDSRREVQLDEESK